MTADSIYAGWWYCVCGHSVDAHLAEVVSPCAASVCDCREFRPAPVAEAAKEQGRLWNA